ncbi:TPA: hypothetical protein QCV70_004734 [Bacillus cereus]|nr:hypothetical protein [Bacillus cereus]MEC2824654.1 hypothetical protein [Bacillus cereus]HDR6757774.1 hypothetical protein [Bacillus cereus]
MNGVKRAFKKSLAIQLMQMGNDLIKIEVNMCNDKLVVYIFRGSAKLQKDLTYFDNLHKNSMQYL